MKNKFKGQILAEVVIAIGIIVVVLVGTSSLMTRNTRTISTNNSKDEAARLTEAQINNYRQLRDRDATTFFALNGITKGVFANCIGGWSQPTPTPVLVPITCEVKFEDLNPVGSGVKVTVRGSWSENNAVNNSVSLSANIMQLQ
jgi:type II secretory pathway pseudopilin PulG